jgi:hypothetical protein
MPSVRVAVRCVSLAIFAGVFGYAGLSSGTLERYLGVASAGDSDIERSSAVESVAAYLPFAMDRALIVKPTKRADIVTVSPAEPETDRLHKSILAYVSERNPGASRRTFRNYPTRARHGGRFATIPRSSSTRPRARTSITVSPSRRRRPSPTSGRTQSARPARSGSTRSCRRRPASSSRRWASCASRASGSTSAIWAISPIR